ncbi:MAG TPA: zinc-ribbon and DUF3426 domain-containing protein [Rhizobacter sp.]|jgi:predicted Zn finger-like uncharacterized protein|nr:zinc-ribbon and DUF3426 domain-containing protein [Rhizobacter sp.]
MSLATRCTSCGTVFRVVQDQLKVSEGWVRCGRCNEVFNAIEGLFDLERDAPPNWKPPPAPTPAPLASTVTAAFEVQPEPPDDDDDVFQLSDGDRIHSRFFQPEQADVEQTPAQAVKARDRVDFADAQFNTALLADGAKPARSGKSGGTGIARSSVKEARAKQEAARRGPGFVQQAKQRERWRSPAMRAMLSFMGLALTAALVGQAAYHFRDLWAAQWPMARPWLAKGCEWLHCEIGAPRRIDDVVVDSSTLSPAPGGNGYRLALVLRNRSSLPLAMPWVEVSLTDPSGQLVARRALAPADFRVNPAVLAPGSESNLQALLSSSDARRISGYTVEIFYP